MKCPICIEEFRIEPRYKFKYCMHIFGRYTAIYLYVNGNATIEIYKKTDEKPTFSFVLFLEEHYVLDEARIEKLILLK